MTQKGVVMQTNFEGVNPPRRGKVRDIYDLGDKLLIVVTDRVSAFDVVLPEGYPGRAGCLTRFPGTGSTRPKT